MKSNKDNSLFFIGKKFSILDEQEKLLFYLEKIIGLENAGKSEKIFFKLFELFEYFSKNDIEIFGYDEIFFRGKDEKIYECRSKQKYVNVILANQLIPECFLKNILKKNFIILHKILSTSNEELFKKYIFYCEINNDNIKYILSNFKLMEYILFSNKFESKIYEDKKILIKKHYISDLLWKEEFEKILNISNKILLDNISDIIYKHLIKKSKENLRKIFYYFLMVNFISCTKDLYFLIYYDFLLFQKKYNILIEIEKYKKEDILFYNRLQDFLNNPNFFINYQNIFAAHFQKDSFLFNELSTNLLYDARIWRIVDKFI